MSTLPDSDPPKWTTEKIKAHADASMMDDSSVSRRLATMCLQLLERLDEAREDGWCKGYEEGYDEGFDAADGRKGDDA